MLAIAGGKGGCGKTTTALGVARALAQRGHKPLVVDADADMPDLHHRAAVPRKPGTDQLVAGKPLSDVVHDSDRVPSVSVLTAGSRANVTAGIRKASGWDGPVLIDCPPGLNPGTVGPLRAASHSIIVTTEQPTCLEDSRRTLKLLRQIGTQPLGLVAVNRTGRQALRAMSDYPVLATVPFSDSPFGSSRVSRGWSQAAAQIPRTGGDQQRVLRGDSSDQSQSRL